MNNSISEKFKVLSDDKLNEVLVNEGGIYTEEEIEAAHAELLWREKDNLETTLNSEDVDFFSGNSIHLWLKQHVFKNFKRSSKWESEDLKNVVRIVSLIFFLVMSLLYWRDFLYTLSAISTYGIDIYFIHILQYILLPFAVIGLFFFRRWGLFLTIVILGIKLIEGFSWWMTGISQYAIQQSEEESEYFYDEFPENAQNMIELSYLLSSGLLLLFWLLIGIFFIQTKVLQFFRAKLQLAAMAVSLSILLYYSSQVVIYLFSLKH